MENKSIRFLSIILIIIGVIMPLILFCMPDMFTPNSFDDIQTHQFIIKSMAYLAISLIFVVVGTGLLKLLKK